MDIEDTVLPNEDWIAEGWGAYDLDYLGEVLFDMIDYMDGEGGYFG